LFFGLNKSSKLPVYVVFALNRACQAARANNIFAGEKPLPGRQAEFVEVKKTGG